MRSTPQVIGAAHDALAWPQTQVETELNGVGDNPIFLPEENLTLTGANFQGTPVSLPMESAVWRSPWSACCRKGGMNRLLNPALSVGLPAFLTKGAGYVLRTHAQPVHRRHADRRTEHTLGPRIDTVDTGGGRPGRLCLHGYERCHEKLHRSSTTHTAYWGSNSWRQPRRWTSANIPGKGVDKAKAVIRRHVEFLDIDRPLIRTTTR